MKITADFTRLTGKIKPMHGVGQPPLSLWRVTDEYMHYLGEAGIPYSRLHDTGGRYGAGVYVDVPNIFRVFDADETLPESYDFRTTDRLISYIKAQGTEPFYRLGITIENDHNLCSYRNYPPKDPAKWARICEHIIRHYNEGWADGFNHGIRYWEIWNEPDDCLPDSGAAMWHGTKESYFELYCVTAKHLKACFGDSISVGGYASCGFYGLDNDPDGTGIPYPVEVIDADGNPQIAEGVERKDFFIHYFHEFLRYVKAEGAPLEFFSWHSYSDPPTTVRMSEYCRKVLEYEGFGDVEDILNEWNTCHDDRRGTAYASANAMAMMLAMQKTETSILCFYDASMGLMTYSGLFNGETKKPYPAYFTFMSFNRAYRLGGEVATESDDGDVYVCGATDGNEKLLIIANRGGRAVDCEIELTGANAEGAEILVIDDTYTYSPTGKKVVGGRIRLTPHSVTEIRLK
ncbi:MAG: hypothetical protein GX628_05345 [Clostridiales bacterium]|nr:hypothetical protein [Clostridiales bacterium]